MSLLIGYQGKLERGEAALELTFSDGLQRRLEWPPEHCLDRPSSPRTCLD